jgi:hypothetical protein
MGGWLVPTYQPATYARTVREPRPPLAHPIVEHVHVGCGRIELDYVWALGPGRLAALEVLLRRLSGDLGAAIVTGGDVTDVLRPFLAVRILGVIPLGRMNGLDALLCFAKLAEILDRGLALVELIGPLPGTLTA